MLNLYEIITKFYTELTMTDIIALCWLVIVIVVVAWCVYAFIKSMVEGERLMKRLVSEAEPHIDLSGSMLDVIMRYGR